jgi:hypothetical protein
VLTILSSDDNTAEKSSKFTLSSIRKSSSVSYRTSTPLGSPKAEKTIGSPGSSPVKDKGTDGGKRKRPASAPHPHPVSGLVSGLDPGSVAVNGVTGMIQQGESILDQIGEPDNVGWMRKRGVRYNSWKLRYFVLQGPHLYCLRSSGKTVRVSCEVLVPQTLTLFCWGRKRVLRITSTSKATRLL